MGTVFNRGTKDRPNWYVGYRENGRWVYKASRQPTKALAKRWVSEIESRIARGNVGIEDQEDAPQFKASFTAFLEGLTNRNAADDRSRGRRHCFRSSSGKRIADIDLGAAMEWIDEQRAAGELSDASIRHNMNLLSRFFSWAIARGKASINPVRQIPMGSRPSQSVKSDTPWLADDAIVRKLIDDLEEPISFMFYLCNRSGLRTAKQRASVSDMDFIEEGVLRVRFSYDGPLKEDKKGEGKVKWVPAPEDCEEFLGPWLAQRRRRARAGGSRVPVRASQGPLLPQGVHRGVLGRSGAEARRRARGLAQEEARQDREREEAEDDLVPGDAAQLRQPSSLGWRVARRGQRRRGPLIAGRHEALLRSLCAPHVLAEAARGSGAR